MKKILTIVTVVCMLVASLFTTSTVSATYVAKDAYQQNDAYSYFVDAKSGKVVESKDGELVATVDSTDGSSLPDSALFTIETYTDVNRIQVINSGTQMIWQSNGDSLVSNAGKVASINTGSWEGFELESTTVVEGATYIKNFSGKYITVNDEGAMSVTTNVGDASAFYIIDAKYDDVSIYFEHKESGEYIKSNGVDKALTVEAADVASLSDEFRYTEVWGNWEGPSVTFNSKAYPDTRWKAGDVDELTQIGGSSHGGWESVRFLANGDGTITFVEPINNNVLSVEGDKIVNTGSTEVTEESKFIVHSVVAPKKASNISVSDIEQNSATVSWTEVTNSLHSGYKVIATPTIGSGLAVIESEEIAGTTTTLTGLEKGTSYDIAVRTVNGLSPFSTSDSVSMQTLNGARPLQPENLSSTYNEGNIIVSFDAVDGATSYDIYHAPSAYAEYEKLDTVTETSYVATGIDPNNRYVHYYKVVANNENGSSALSSEFTSLETELFGENTIFIAETDTVENIDTVINDVFTLQNDFDADAQFNELRYSIYFKPGDYTETSVMNLGYYTQFAGLGELPTDVKLNNIAIPAYLPEGELGGDGNNATCNFWRSTENVAVYNTGNEQGKTQDGSWRADDLNWAVAQAAPLRRIYSERNISYDWNYGWASGGYVADSYIAADAGTHSGQQFYTRNSTITGEIFGTTLNNFYQGVEAPNSVNTLDESNANLLTSGEGYSNWSIPGAENNQQVFTMIDSTEELSEKPFLYLDGGEYKVFVPSIEENTSGTSWNHETGDMGKGESISIDEFFIAKEGDSAATINEQLEAGKNIFFSAGIYYAEEPIVVNNPDTIILGSGYASIIPTNDEAAMITGDVGGLIIAGLVFDAGEHSEYLLKVGNEKTDVRHEDNPTVLQDLFFRIGGTTDILTKADNALEINTNDVIGDHFWIWRADHGAGVEWYGNESAHGLIVNGDHMTMYGLFVEHFQSYNTLWNGEHGKTYFYQNEATYDPISQEAWMSHNGTVNGYSSYKVANHVDNHYAVGLGIYNVFIYTGPTYDSTEVQIQLDNPIEVPNKENVIIENACTQTFANDEKVLQKFNYIINGVGNSVSSGTDSETGETGTGWARQFITLYQNGTASVGKKQNSEHENGKYIGEDIIENIAQPMNEPGDVDLSALQDMYDDALLLDESDYTKASWEIFEEAMSKAAVQLNDKGEDWAVQSDVDSAYTLLDEAKKALTVETSTPTPSLVTIENAEHDIIIEELTDTIIDEDTLVDVQLVTLTDEQINMVKNTTSSEDELVLAYDISLLQGGDIVTLDGTVLVKIKLSEEQIEQYSNFTVVYVDADGNTEEMKSSLVGGYLCFETTHFSVYSLLATTNNTTEVPNEGESTTPNTGDTTVPNEGESTTPNTGDSTNLAIYALLSLGALSILVSERKKVKVN